MTSSARLNSLIESPASGSEQPFSMMEEEVVGALMLALNPGFDALTSRLRDLELHGTLRLALRDQSATRNAVTMANVPDSQSDQVASPQLAIEAQIEQR